MTKFVRRVLVQTDGQTGTVGTAGTSTVQVFHRWCWHNSNTFLGLYEGTKVLERLQTLHWRALPVVS